MPEGAGAGHCGWGASKGVFRPHHPFCNRNRLVQAIREGSQAVGRHDHGGSCGKLREVSPSSHLRGRAGRIFSPAAREGGGAFSVSRIPLNQTGRTFTTPAKALGAPGSTQVWATAAPARGGHPVGIRDPVHQGRPAAQEVLATSRELPHGREGSERHDQSWGACSG